MSTVEEQYENVQQEMIDINKNYIGVKPKGPGLSKNHGLKICIDGKQFDANENKEQDCFNGENDNGGEEEKNGYNGGEEENNDCYKGGEEDKENEEGVGPVCVDVNNQNEGNGDVEENYMGSFMDEDFFDQNNDGFVGPVDQRNWFCPKENSKFMKIGTRNESVKTTCSYNWIKQEIENCCDNRVKKLQSRQYEFIRNKDCRIVVPDNRNKVGKCRFMFDEKIVYGWLPYSILIEKPFVRIQTVYV